MIELKSKDGYIYRNGNSFGRVVLLPKEELASEWILVPESEYQSYLEEQEKEFKLIEEQRLKELQTQPIETRDSES